MAEDRNILIEDDEGNRYFPHTKANNVLTGDGQSAEDRLDFLQEGLTHTAVDLVNHRNDENNPHKVKAPQVSIEPIEGMDATDVQGAIEETKTIAEDAEDKAGEAQSGLTTHRNSTIVHGATSEALPNRIILRDANNQAMVGAPTNSSHIARKADVDAVRALIQPRAATIIVAANNSSDKSKRAADVVCTSHFVVDDLLYAIRLVSGNGGKVLLLEGDYHIREGVSNEGGMGIELYSPVSIQGMGVGTRLISSYQTVPGEAFIFRILADNVTISDLELNGNRAVPGNENVCGIYLESSNYTNNVFSNLIVRQFQSKGIQIRGYDSGYGISVTNCTFNSNSVGLSTEGGSGYAHAIISNNHFNDSAVVLDQSYSLLSNNYFVKGWNQNTMLNLLSSSFRNAVSGNYFYGANQAQSIVDQGTSNMISNNYFDR